MQNKQVLLQWMSIHADACFESNSLFGNKIVVFSYYIMTHGFYREKGWWLRSNFDLNQWFDINLEWIRNFRLRKSFPLFVNDCCCEMFFVQHILYSAHEESKKCLLMKMLSMPNWIWLILYWAYVPSFPVFKCKIDWYISYLYWLLWYNSVSFFGCWVSIIEQKFILTSR